MKNFKLTLLALFAVVASVFVTGCTSNYNDGYGNDGYAYQQPVYDYNANPVYIMQGGSYVRIYSTPAVGVSVYSRSSNGSYGVSSSYTGYRTRVAQSTTMARSAGTTGRSSGSSSSNGGWRGGSSSTRSSTPSSSGGGWRGGSSSSSSMGGGWRGSSSSGSSSSSSGSSSRSGRR